jgi:hypothetical protein
VAIGRRMKSSETFMNPANPVNDLNLLYPANRSNLVNPVQW